MAERPAEVRLEDGTLIRHKVTGYQGRIDGTTAIRECFTTGGASLGSGSSKHAFQYRVVVAGESLRKIAPVEDLEVLEGVVTVVCPSCGNSFQSAPGAPGKIAGRCECGGFICPACLSCQGPTRDAKGESPCLKQRKRLVSKLAREKKKRKG